MSLCHCQDGEPLDLKRLICQVEYDRDERGTVSMTAIEVTRDCLRDRCKHLRALEGRAREHVD